MRTTLHNPKLLSGSGKFWDLMTMMKDANLFNSSQARVKCLWKVLLLYKESEEPTNSKYRKFSTETLTGFQLLIHGKTF